MGKYGIVSATTMAKDMLRFFESIRIELMVGIEEGAPSKKHDIKLDDVIIECSVGRTSDVLSYKFGKAMQGKDFEITKDLNSSSTILLTTLNRLDMLHERKGNDMVDIVRTMISKNPRMQGKYSYLGAKKDR